MKWNNHWLPRGVLASMLLLAFASHAGPAPQFKVIPLTLGGKYCQVAAIKDGRAVGSASPTAKTPKHAFLWTEADGMKDLGTLGGTFASASAVDGQRVVGLSQIGGDSEFHAFTWTPTGGMKDLGTLGGNYSAANGVSGDQVVGDSTTASGDLHAFRWRPSTGMIDLGTLGNGTESSAARIDGSLIAGWSATSGNAIGTRRPVVWLSGQLIDIVGTPLDIDADGNVRNSGATVDAANGFATGYFATPNLLVHAFRWSAGGGFVDLGVPAGYLESFAASTRGGQIAGTVAAGSNAGYAQRPFVWTSSSGFKVLGSLGGDSNAVAINTGRVVGTFILSQGGFHTFHWSATGGLHDVTPKAFLTSGAAPVGIDSAGRVAITDQHSRSSILVPR